MIEAFKQVFFGLFWFTADVVMIFVWIVLIETIIEKVKKHD